MTKILSLTSLAFWLWSASTASALLLEHKSWERPQMFATCAGRLAAMASHEYRKSPEQFHDTLNQIALFNELLEATLPLAEDNGLDRIEVEGWRYQARNDIAVAIDNAFFSYDSQIAEFAKQKVQREVDSCRALIGGAY